MPYIRPIRRLPPRAKAGLLASAVAGLLPFAPATLQAENIRPEIIFNIDSNDSTRALLEGNSLAKSLEAQDDASAADYIAAARADYRRMLTALYDRGFYGPTISITVDGREASTIAPLDAPATLGNITITVDQGRRFQFGQTNVGPRHEDLALPEGFAAGENAYSPVIRDAVQRVVARWRNEGHPLVEVTEESIRALHAESRLDVDVRIDPGPQLRFAPLQVGPRAADDIPDVRDERIIAIAGLPRGDLYSPEQVAKAQARLRRTGAFATVAMIQSDTANADGTYTVTAQVGEMLPRRLGFGAEISSTDGLALSGYWMHRNLLGGAERLRLDLEITDIQNSVDSGGGGADVVLGLSFGRPAVFNPDTDFTVDIDLMRMDERDYLLTAFNIEAGFIKYVRDDLTYRFGAGLLTAREETAFDTRDYTLLTFPFGATLDQRNDKFNATSGFYADVDVTPFTGLDGGADGGRVYADSRYYYSFGQMAEGKNRVTLAARGQVGSVLGADLLDAPRDYLFYSGGGGTVRGQSFQSLGINLSRDAGESLRVGGRSFVGLQAEARVGITGAISAVGFYDFGAIDVDAFPDADSPWHAGAGLGLRYDTAIGPIRLDLATPVTGDNAYEKVELYLGIGQAF